MSLGQVCMMQNEDVGRPPLRSFADTTGNDCRGGIQSQLKTWVVKRPVQRTDIPAPGENILAALKLGVHLMRQGDYITEYEVKLATKIAQVLCGGNVTAGTPISEQYVLDLEREGFKSLCGEKKTQERIQYTLKTGKTLRN